MLTKALKNMLVNRCTQRTSTFAKLGDTKQTKDGPLTWIDNGGSVLAVAHLDWVMSRPPLLVGDMIKCPQLDDRLGVWTILDLLPKLGVKVDVLLTDSEEVGRSTSQYFETSKEYNWMFQFDRRGTDVVMYQYGTDENGERLEKYGFKVGSGTFSDICSLDFLGISGWNVGVGYHNEHSDKCYADLNDTYMNAVKFAEFWNDWKDTPIPAPPEEDRAGYGWWRNSSKPYQYDGNYWLDSTSNRDSDNDRKLILPDSYDNEDEYYCWQCQCGAIWFVSEVICDGCGGDVDDAIWNEEVGWQDIPDRDDDDDPDSRCPEDTELEIAYELELENEGWRLPD